MTEKPTRALKRVRRRFAPLVMLGSVAAFAMVSFAVAGTLSGFTASINNTVNNAGAGTLVMEEDSGALTCLSSTGTAVTTANAGTCATINKLGGNLAMVPGQVVTTTLTVKNNGTITPTTFTLTPSTCSQTHNALLFGSATDICTKMQVVIKSGTTAVFSGTAATLSALVTIPVAVIPGPGASTPFTFTVTLDATVDNSYQGLIASQTLLWSFA
jgi:hypothetical protein